MERRRHSEAEYLGGLEVEDQLDLGLDLLDRRFSSPVALENTSSINTNQTAQIRNTAAVANQVADRHEPCEVNSPRIADPAHTGVHL